MLPSVGNISMNAQFFHLAKVKVQSSHLQHTTLLLKCCKATTPSLDSIRQCVYLITFGIFPFFDTWKTEKEGGKRGLLRCDKGSWQASNWRCSQLHAMRHEPLVHTDAAYMFVWVHVLYLCVSTGGVTWVLWECSGCQKLIYNAGLSLSRLLRVQGKERMLSQVSNKSVPSTAETIELCE